MFSRSLERPPLSSRRQQNTRSRGDRQGRDEDLRWLLWIPLLIVNKAGDIPLNPAAPTLMVSLFSSRYERASLIVTPTRPSPPRAQSSATRYVAAAMIRPRIVATAGVSRKPATTSRAAQTLDSRATATRGGSPNGGGRSPSSVVNAARELFCRPGLPLPRTDRSV
jgi:hypothetical protein